MTRHWQASLISLGALSAALIAPFPALAEEVPNGSSPTPEVVADIVVTGTQIRGAAPVGSTIISVDRKTIESTGLSTTNDILRTIPQVTGLGPGEATTGPNVNNSGLNVTRANSINLRGLGPQATLTLLNGRRVPPGGTGAQLFDPSTIPALALASIDVVADGASATYGSDAVAGVANLILRRDVEGVEATGRYGGAADYRDHQLGLIAGRHWTGGSVMIAGEYTFNTQLQQSQRAAMFNCDQTSYGYNNVCAGNPSAPGNLVFGTTVYGLPAGSGVGVTSTQLSTTRNTFPSSVFQGVIPKSTRYGTVGSLRQELGPVTLWTEGFFDRRNGFYYIGTPTINTAVPSTNPNFITVPGQSSTSESVQYSLVNDFGPATAKTFEQSWQAAAGIDVRLKGGWTFSAYYEHNADREYLLRLGQINSNLLRTALACTTSVCFNPFGTGGSSNSAAVASFFGYVNQNSYYNSNLINAKLDGTLFQLPGGDLKAAVGGEYHDDSLFNYSVNNTGANATTLSTIVSTANTRSARRVYSAYGEIIIPIFGANNAIPGIRKLTLDVAGRYDQYTGVGHTTNPKVGVTWEVVNGLVLRGSYGTSFRAPTVSDINPLSTASVLTSTTAAGPGRNVASVVGGNADLKPETAKTWSLGVDFRPTGLRGFNASVNYYHILYQNIIDTPGNNQSAVFANPALYAPFVIFNPNQAQIDAVKALPFYVPITTFGAAGFAPGNVYAILDGRRNNVGSLTTNGIDFTANYRFDTGIGRWNLGVSGNYVFHYKYQVLAGAVIIDRVNQATFPVRFRARGQFGWNSGPVDVNGFLNFTNSYKVVGLVNTAQNDRVSSYTTFDTTVSYTFGPKSGALHDLKISLSAINLFDRSPPLALVTTTQEYDSAGANILGRQVSVTVRKKF